MEPVSTQWFVCNNIIVHDEKNQIFLDKITSAIEILKSQNVGKRLINKIINGKHRVIIKYDRNVNNCEAHDSKEATKRGVGCSSTIRLNFEKPSLCGFKGEEIESPFFVKLAHELIHALHNSHGKNNGYSTCGVWSNQEELKTIYPEVDLKRTKPKISENAIRAEHGLPLRFSHYSYNAYTKASFEQKKEFKSKGIGTLITSVAVPIFSTMPFEK